MNQQGYEPATPWFSGYTCIKFLNQASDLLSGMANWELAADRQLSNGLR
ncbi:hypothetical protein [Brucella anthropi]